jgi:tetratricopeptide (TPR) repeat protein
LYPRPVHAIGRILDQGRLGFSAAFALIVAVLLHAADLGPRQAGVPNVPSASILTGPASVAFLRFISFAPGSWLFPIVCVAGAFVPAMLLTRALAGFGSFAVLMEAEYVALLNCVLMCWAAAYLPLALERLAGVAPLDALPMYVGASLYLATLTALSARAVFGTSFAAASGLAALGWGAAVLGGTVFVLAGALPRFLLSPFLLFYLYLVLGPQLRSLGAGLRSRQQLRRQLEIATNNPRDADAHYQLGLIFERRRQFSEAIAHFERAIEIDPREADAHLQLGRLARGQGRFEEAARELKTAAAIDDKLATSEVWRELGAACCEWSHFDDAADALAKYTKRRPYDPEGLYWYGKVLRHLDKSAEARELFERSVDAVATMPSHRRAHLRKWRSLAQAELRTLQ